MSDSSQQLHEITGEFVSKIKPLCKLVKEEDGTSLTMNSSVFEAVLMLASYIEDLNEKRRNMTLSILSAMKKKLINLKIFIILCFLKDI